MYGDAYIGYPDKLASAKDEYIRGFLETVHSAPGKKINMVNLGKALYPFDDDKRVKFKQAAMDDVAIESAFKAGALGGGGFSIVKDINQFTNPEAGAAYQRLEATIAKSGDQSLVRSLDSIVRGPYDPVRKKTLIRGLLQSTNPIGWTEYMNVLDSFGGTK